MADTPGGPVRQDLAALRIDRSASEPRRRTWLWVAIGVGAALAVATLIYVTAFRSAPSVQVAYATRSGGDEVHASAVLTGSGYVVTADRYLSLGARVPGRIEAYLVDEGDTVAARQALVRLDPRPYEAQLRRAEAGVRLAQANASLSRKEVARLTELHSQNVSALSELDIKQNQLEVALAEIARLEAEIAQVTLDLEDTVVRAPTSGVILEKFKEVGEIATPGGFAGSGDLVRMANLDELRAEVDISETELARIHLGQPAEVVPDAYPDRSYAARVVKLAPQIDRSKGTLEVEVEILEPDARLRPDMSVRITFLEKVRPETDGEGAVLVPAAALRSDTSGAFVWVVTGGVLRRQPLEARGRVGDRVIVVSGLAGGEQLVVGPADGLREGQAVAVSE